MVIEKGQRFTFRVGGGTTGTGIVTNINKRLTEAERLALTEGKKARQKKMASAAN